MMKKEKIIEGIKVSYLDQRSEKNEGTNQQPLVIFLHGWGAKAEVFRTLFACVPEYLALDFPGFGASGKLQKIWTLEDFARVTRSWIASMVPENQSIILVGHSFGGRVILKMLQEKMITNPLQKIIFIGVPFYRKKNWKIQILEKISKRGEQFPFLKNIGKKILYSFWKNSDYESLENDEMMKKTFQNVIHEDVSAYLATLHAQSVECLWGTHDEVTPLSFALDAQKKVPTIGIHTFEGAKHLPFLDQKEEFAKVFKAMI